MHKPGGGAELDFASNKANDIFTAFERSTLWPPSTADDGQKMLSFSSSQPYSGAGSTRSIAFSNCQVENQSRNGGGGVRGSGTFTRLKGPFTPSQWMELEHQALIYKHIVANVPVPSNLLAPIRRALYSYGSCASNLLGWGPFQLGISSGNNDPEPGRCRRTDGKKWRCSRDAVPEQKYCERHINRGRHRSRKHVEGQSGHAVSKIACSSPAASGISSSNATASSMQHQLQPNASTNQLVTRSQGLSSIGQKSKDASFSTQKQHVPFNESSHSEFGIVSSDSLLNPTERISYSDSFPRFNPKEANNQQPVHHFIDDWPKDQPQELKSDWTQLSMSIPDFSSSSTSPAQEKSSISTMRLSHELDPTHMSLGGATHYLEKQPWSPTIWGSLNGGPLGEVLTNGPTSVKSWKSSFSPTGVLQKSNFVSLSNSSSGSSADNKKAPESVGLCNDLLGPGLVTSAAIPTL